MFVQPVKNTAEITTVPAPIGGLNALDSLAAMPASDAPTMVNWYPQSYGVMLRRGYQEHATGLGGSVESLATWADDAGIESLFAWANGTMWDISSSTLNIPPTAVVTGLSSDRWNSITFANTAGSHLVAFSGFDNGIIYDDTGLHRLVAGNGTDPYTISGVDPATIIDVTSHDHRIWMVQKDTTYGWYLPTDAIYGVAERYDFGSLFKRGGYLAMLRTWTVDDGDGAEDHLVAISSRGEIAVYSGSDVEDPTNWRLAGLYYVGAPLKGRRSAIKVAGDLMILTQIGVVSLTQVMASSQVNATQSTVDSSKIQFLIANLTSEYKELDGWEIFYSSPYNMLLINVPILTDPFVLQVASNMLTKSWTMFAGMKARCWTLYDDFPFFGDSNGSVYRAWYGNADGVLLDGTEGRAVVGQVQQAYSYFNSLAGQKQIGMYRPNMIVESPIQYYSDIQYDFSFNRLPDPTPSRNFGQPLWDQAIWDQSQWYGGGVAQRDWRSSEGIGVAASIRLAVAAKVEVLWISTDYTLKKGGPL